MNEYEKLTEKFIQDMEAVKGPFKDFVDGLEYAVHTLRERWNLAQDELEEQS